MCYGTEPTPESMPGWPISQKEIKDLVPSTNDSLVELKRGKCFFSLPFLPPPVRLLLSNSVCQLGVHSETPPEY